MKLSYVLGVSILSILMILYEWRKMESGQKKEKVTLLILTGTGWIFAVLLIFFPSLPGPFDLHTRLFSELIEFIVNY